MEAITLRDCDFNALFQMLIHIYGGEPEITGTNYYFLILPSPMVFCFFIFVVFYFIIFSNMIGDNIEGVLRLAHLYNNHDLVSLCKTMMQDAIDADNCLSILYLLVC